MIYSSSAPIAGKGDNTFGTQMALEKSFCRADNDLATVQSSKMERGGISKGLSKSLFSCKMCDRLQHAQNGDI